MSEQQKGFFRKLLDKYDEFCRDAGIDVGNCRGCVPVVKFDDDGKQIKDDQPQQKEQN